IMGAFGANAQTDTTAATTATPTDEGSLSINGYVDTYYFYNTNKPSTRLNQARVFDTKHDNFSIGLVQTAFTYTKGKVKVVADLVFGPNAELANFGNTGTSLGIKQAYGTYSFTDKLSLTVGQFGTHIGYELIDAPLNYNYSLSYLFGNGPFYHTGAKVDYVASDKFGVMFGVVNGWDELQDFNNKKTIVAQVHLMPVEGFNVYTNFVTGDESKGLSYFGAKDGCRTSLFDLSTTFQVNEAFKIGVDAAYGIFTTGYDREITDQDIADAATPEEAEFLTSEKRYSKDNEWKGAALYLNYAMNPVFGLGLRAERFSDPTGMRYFGPIEATAFTLTGDIKLADGAFNLKPEVRFDATDDPYFLSGASKLKKNQTTIGAAVIYTFNGKFGK
ncbi:MAG: porin, partial [Bacteroidota bacterium]|nr:porin [Bacteroidota bacterium]